MTALTRPVRRTVPRERRDLVVTLLPGPAPMIEVREKGLRTGYSVTLAALYVILAQRDADNRRAARKPRVRRGAL